MIFKQVDEILSGRKTQTRRVCKLDEGYFTYRNEGDPTNSLVTNTSGTVKWEVGRTYAVVPKRGQPAVWHRQTEDRHYWLNNATKYFSVVELKADDWQPLRIRILSIWQERLQDITEADAKAEGVESVEEYRELWQRINGKTKGARWDDNPLVYVLSFEVAKDN